MLIARFSFTDAAYSSIVTMATVGYGDIHPQTDMEKILAPILIVGGVGTFLGVIARITDLFVNRREAAPRRQKPNMVTGLFFSEMGSELLKRFYRQAPGTETFVKMTEGRYARTTRSADRCRYSEQEASPRPPHYRCRGLLVKNHRQRVPGRFLQKYTGSYHPPDYPPGEIYRIALIR
jgi:hypothetical protein